MANQDPAAAERFSNAFSIKGPGDSDLAYSGLNIETITERIGIIRQRWLVNILGLRGFIHEGNSQHVGAGLYRNSEVQPVISIVFFGLTPSTDLLAADRESFDEFAVQA